MNPSCVHADLETPVDDAAHRPKTTKCPGVLFVISNVLSAHGEPAGCSDSAIKSSSGHVKSCAFAKDGVAFRVTAPRQNNALPWAP